MKEELERLQQQQVILRLKALGRVIIQYKKKDIAEDKAPLTLQPGQTLDQAQKQKRAYREEREAIAEEFLANVKQILIGSDLVRLRARLDLRKEITRDFKDKYHRVSEELYKLKLDSNQQINEFDSMKLKVQEALTTESRLESNVLTLETELGKNIQEIEILRGANSATLGMIDNIMKQKLLLEEKYNCYLEEMEDGDMVLKRKLRTKEDDGEKKPL